LPWRVGWNGFLNHGVGLRFAFSIVTQFDAVFLDNTMTMRRFPYHDPVYSKPEQMPTTDACEICGRSYPMRITQWHLRRCGYCIANRRSILETTEKILAKREKHDTLDLTESPETLENEGNHHAALCIDD